MISYRPHHTCTRQLDMAVYQPSKPSSPPRISGAVQTRSNLRHWCKVSPPATQRGRYAPRYFVIGVESYMLCDTSPLNIVSMPLFFISPFVEDVRPWSFVAVWVSWGLSVVLISFTCYTMRMSDVRFTDLRGRIRKEPPECHRATSIFVCIVDLSPFSRFQFESALRSGEVRLIDLRSWRYQAPFLC